jgi:hypothetical protein
MSNEFRTNDIITFYALGKVVKVYGDMLVVRSEKGQKHYVRAQHAKKANEGARRKYYQKAMATERHEHWRPQ